MSDSAENDPAHVNVASHLRSAAESRPFKKAVVCPSGRDRHGRVTYAHLTFRQLDRKSDRLAHGLQGAGIGRGVRTILMVRPGIEFFELIFAIFKVGAVPVVVDPRMGIRRMLTCFRSTRPRAFIGVPLAHAVRTFFPKYFRTVKVWVTVGRRAFWGGHTLTSILDLFWYGDKVFVTIRDVDYEQRQIGLSLAPSENLPSENPLPAKSKPSAANGMPAKAEESLATYIRRRHILVVEDEILQSDAVCGWLRELGQSVDVAHSAEEALAFLEKTSPYIVLIDVGLPVMSGTDLARYILEQYAQVQVVIATDWARASEVKVHLDELQARGGKLLYKPLLPEDIVSLSFIRTGSTKPTDTTGRKAVAFQYSKAGCQEVNPFIVDGIQKPPWRGPIAGWYRWSRRA